MFQGSIRTSSVNIRLHTSSGNAGNLTYTHKKTLEFNTNPAPSNQVISQRIRKANHVNQQPHPKRYHGHPSMLKQLQHPPWAAMPSSRLPTVETSCKPISLY